MSLDITTLRFLRLRDRYERLAKAIPARALDIRTQTLLTDYGRYYREFPEVKELQAEPFLLLFNSIHPTLKEEDVSVYRALFKRVCEEPADPSIESGLLTRLATSAAATDLADLIQSFNDGAEVDLRTGVQTIVEQFDTTVDRKIKNPQVLDPIEDILQAEVDEVGFHWRLGCLHRHIKPTRPGDFVVIAARPDKGKTSLMASEATHAAAQMDSVFPGERRSVLWLNNEGPGRNIVSRCFQAALSATIEDMFKLQKQSCSTPEAEKQYKHALREQYAAALGGRAGSLRIFDIHGMWNHEVEDLFRIHNPGLVIFDMVDNIKFGGDVGNGGTRTDQLLESMYQWARLMGVKYDCGVWATSQVSGDGDGLQFPSLGMLKDSKTGKQGAADVIIVMGAVNDPMLENSRYFGTTKNKRARTGVKSSPNQEVLFDKDRSRFFEPE